MANIPLYTVFGNPIAHSKSPQIHQYFAAQEGVSIEYTRTLVADPRHFQAALSHFFETGVGANITLPFKTEALSLVHECTERAQMAGAVNTIKCLANGHLLGDNTDGTGLVYDIQHNHHVDLSGKKVLILGAGGAARGIILPLKNADAAQLIIANRNHDKAQYLAKIFGITAVEMAHLSGDFDVVINATSSSVSGDALPVNARVFSGSLLVYDLFYDAKPTPFMRFAKESGAQQCADGLGMLVAQAAQSYELWRGFRPDVGRVITQLRAQMQNAG